MMRVCDSLSIPYDPQTMEAPFDVPTDTCMVGGNKAIYAQRVKNSVFFDCQAEFQLYLNEKYLRKQGVIFLDEMWRHDARFKKIIREYYASRDIKRPVDKIAKHIGYPEGIEGFLEDLSATTGA